MSAGILKVLITILFVLLLISLVTGFHFLFKDNGAPDSNRTFRALVIRVALTVALVGVIGYGFASGALKSQAPWERAEATSPEGQKKP